MHDNFHFYYTVLLECRWPEETETRIAAMVVHPFLNEFLIMYKCKPGFELVGEWIIPCIPDFSTYTYYIDEDAAPTCKRMYTCFVIIDIDCIINLWLVK